MKITKQEQELIKFVDFVTDRFFGQQILPYMLKNAIDDYRQIYKQDYSQKPLAEWTKADIYAYERDHEKVV